jgi:hypothetical protein
MTRPRRRRRLYLRYTEGRWSIATLEVLDGGATPTNPRPVDEERCSGELDESDQCSLDHRCRVTDLYRSYASTNDPRALERYLRAHRSSSGGEIS